jgi:hypothetical protein
MVGKLFFPTFRKNIHASAYCIMLTHIFYRRRNGNELCLPEHADESRCMQALYKGA